MYARTVDGKTLTLAVSGKLWNRSLVMIDSETKTLWSHLLGEAMRGELKGTLLKSIPATMTDWKTWRKMHPKTTVVKLSRTARVFRREFYRDPSLFVIGLTQSDEARAWPFDQLLKQPLVNDQLGELPLVITFEGDSKSAFVFDRRVEGKSVTFEQKEGVLVDPKTGDQWNRQTGKSLSGKADLKPVAAIVSYRKAWSIFHPKTKYYKAPK